MCGFLLRFSLGRKPNHGIELWDFALKKNPAVKPPLSTANFEQSQHWEAKKRRLYLILFLYAIDRGNEFLELKNRGVKWKSVVKHKVGEHVVLLLATFWLTQNTPASIGKVGIILRKPILVPKIAGHANFRVTADSTFQSSQISFFQVGWDYSFQVGSYYTSWNGSFRTRANLPRFDPISAVKSMEFFESISERNFSRLRGDWKQQKC